MDLEPNAEINKELTDMLKGHNKQIGGDHYSKHKIQPFDVIDEYDLNYYEGNVLKYLLRHKDKNGIEDLKKAAHYLDVLIEKECKKS